MALALKPVTITAATTLTRNRHAGCITNLNSTTGRAITLPAATGTGDVYTIYVIATVSSGNHTIVCGSGDYMIGGVSISTDIGGVTMLSTTTTGTLTMNGSTMGGLIGSWVQLTDAATNKWMLSGFLCSTGSEGTPF